MNSASLSASRNNFVSRFMPASWLVISVSALVAVLLWDMGGLDVAVARHMGGSQGFPLQHAYLMEVVMHQDMRDLGWLLWAVLVVAVPFPFGWLRRLPLRERVQLPVGVLLCLMAVVLLKHSSHTSCPWDLQLFGGKVPYVSHWLLGVSDGGGGRCFPAGHASAGFAFVAGFFALRRHLPRLASGWLSMALVAGVVLGLSQQWRGAHFTSHTLWTAWICWTLGGLVDAAFHLRRR